MTPFQTLQTWIGYNTMHYHNLKALPHKLPQARYHIFLRFYWFWAICNTFQQVPTIFCKKILIYIFFINLTETRSNALQIAPNNGKLRKWNMSLYIFSEISLVLCFLQRVTMPYRHFLKKKNMHFLINLTRMHCNTWKIAPNHDKLR